MIELGGRGRLIALAMMATFVAGLGEGSRAEARGPSSDEPAAICEFGDSRGPHCYLGEMTFCRGVKRSVLFPSLIECGDSRRSCYPKECRPSFVTEKGKVVVFAYDRFSELSAELVTGQSEKGYAALYTRDGLNLIRSATGFWGCTGLRMIDDHRIECSGEKPGLFKIADLKAFRARQIPVKTLIAHSRMDVCAASRDQGEGLLQFWANRFRIGANKYAIHLVRLDSGARACQFQTMSGPKCYRLFVDAEGVVCRSHEGETRLLRKDLSLEVREKNFREWREEASQETLTGLEIENLSDQGLIDVTDRDGLLKSRE